MKPKSLFKIFFGLILTCLMVAPAWAQATSTARVVVKPGPLTLQGAAGAVLNFNDAALFVDYANAQTVTGSSYTGSGVVNITDRRGKSSNGWHVTMVATNFTGTSNATATINATNFTYSPSGGAGVVTKLNGPPDTVPPAEIGGGAVALSSAITVSHATAGNGRGLYTYTPTPGSFSLSVPAGTMDDTYNSTVTLTLVAGP